MMVRKKRTDEEMRVLETASLELERISAACEVFFSCNEQATEESAWIGIPSLRRAIVVMGRIQELADNTRRVIARAEGV
jgi:predicted ATP-dependent serine protease